jgi:hypothetical protein
VTIEARSATTRLHLLVDSTGIKMLGEGESTAQGTAITYICIYKGK